MNIEVYNLYNQMNTHIYQNVDVVEENDSFTVIDNYTNKKTEYLLYDGYSWRELTSNEEEVLEIHSKSDINYKNIVIPGCKKIILTEKGINAQIEITFENFDNIEYIVINDYKFKRER